MIDAVMEREYNVRARREDFDALVADWQTRSQSARAERHCRLDLPYGAGDRERVDVFVCDDPGAPTLLYVHGGYWQRHDKSIYSFLAPAFVDSGANVALMSYDLCPAVTLAEITAQVAKALAWLWREAGSLGIARERITLSGHSAGGHLTAMMLTRDRPIPGIGAEAGVVSSAVPISGIYDLGPLRQTSINEAVGIDDAIASEFSPMHRVPRHGVPVMAVVGRAESGEFRRQTEDFVAAWAGRGAEIVQHTEPGADHFDVVDRLADPASGLFRRVRAWLR